MVNSLEISYIKDLDAVFEQELGKLGVPKDKLGKIREVVYFFLHRYDDRLIKEAKKKNLLPEVLADCFISTAELVMEKTFSLSQRKEFENQIVQRLGVLEQGG